MVDPETLAEPDAAAASALDASLADLGRRIDAAKADADRRADAPPRRPFPMLWVAAVLLVTAMIAGGLALAAGGDDDDEVTGAGARSAQTTATTASDAPSTTDAPATTVASATTSTPATTAPAPAAGPAAPDTTAPPAAGPAATPGGAPSANAPNQTVREITVVVGDSFWSIAEREVAAQLGRPATDAEVTGWWADFVAANADRLVEPGNPDLILPGQALVTPAGAA